MSGSYAPKTAEVVCAPTKTEHDLIVALRGRPFTDDGMRVRNLDAPADNPTSLVDSYVTAARRGELSAPRTTSVRVRR